IGLRLDDEDLLAAENPFRNLRLELVGPTGEAMAANDLVGRHETDIVPVLLVFSPRIPEAGNDMHRRQSRGRDRLFFGFALFAVRAVFVAAFRTKSGRGGDGSDGEV